MIESPELQRSLLRIARETARRALTGTDSGPGECPSLSVPCGGLFVTFWRGKTLRGCVGTFAPNADLAVAVQDTTRAALKDPRFATTPITVDELAVLNIELSILSTPTRTAEPASLVAGAHGVIIKRGFRTGCFLPRVAVDRDWTIEEFLSNCCTMKARLPADAWRQPETEVLAFTAQVFSEADLVPDPLPAGARA